MSHMIINIYKVFYEVTATDFSSVICSLTALSYDSYTVPVMSALLLMLLPCFCDDFRCYICRGPADSVEGSVHHSRQTKVSQFQAFAAVRMLVHLNALKTHKQQILLIVGS